ncbi:hypothetical protein MHH70_13780 [Metasolibacillus sp. FSL H7-0170]|uniref:hypothetical protein n=1 Tax=Metasolibacillus TaxID=2703677 RepID=UPI00079A642B|nr:hypothetical protein [Metasolibacillus fluoroglycofenilyticus]KYG89691.1 hypothetical protein A0U40_10345 [[Bacillus] sp. KCTC 13219]
MDGKKFALMLVSIIVGASLLVAIVMLLFFNFYEAPNQDGEPISTDESSLLTPDKAPTIIVLNSR